MIKWDDLIENIRLLKYSIETLEDKKEHFLFMMIYFVYMAGCHP